jgi:hypothetical protein
MLENPNLEIGSHGTKTNGDHQNRTDSISSNNFGLSEKITPKMSNFASLIQNEPEKMNLANVEKNPKNLQGQSKEDPQVICRGQLKSLGGSGIGDLAGVNGEVILSAQNSRSRGGSCSQQN